MKRSVKTLARRMLPRFVTHRAKLRYYPRLLRSVSEDVEPEFPIVAALLEPGDVVVDIGANVGVTSVFFSRCVGPAGHVHAFEPFPETFAYLRAGIGSLGLGNVTLYNVALSDAPGETEMIVPPYDEGGDNLYRARLAEADTAAGGGRRAKVKISTLDAELADRLDALALIKCDVEGHELPCFRGAERCLTRFEPSVLVEINDPIDRAYPDAYALHAMLSDRGYGCYVLHETALRPWAPGETRVNYFYLRPAAFERLAEAGLAGEA